MNDYTPSRFQVKEAYSQGETARWAEFDRFIAEVERAAAEKGWDELAQKLAHDWYWHDGGKDENPYRKCTP